MSENEEGIRLKYVCFDDRWQATRHWSCAKHPMCPHCDKRMYLMPDGFMTPKKSDVKIWERVRKDFFDAQSQDEIEEFRERYGKQER